MDQEEQQQREKEQKNATLNKESPVWFPEKKEFLVFWQKNNNQLTAAINRSSMFVFASGKMRIHHITVRAKTKTKKKIVKTTVHRNFSVSFYVFQLFT